MTDLKSKEYIEMERQKELKKQQKQLKKQQKNKIQLKKQEEIETGITDIPLLVQVKNKIFNSSKKKRG